MQCRRQARSALLVTQRRWGLRLVDEGAQPVLVADECHAVVATAAGLDQTENRQLPL
jgi:hypothetical protein